MKRQKYSLSYYHPTTFDPGALVPVGVTEVLPGDTFKASTSALIRFNAMLAPLMHVVEAKIHHWFVPHRLVWEDWEDFITGGPDGLDASVFPTMTLTPGLAGSLQDYLVHPSPTGPISALPFRAYSLIFNEWYRDQDLQTPLTVNIGSGPDTTTNTTLQSVAWQKDYLNTARPWTQKGPDVVIPMASQAPVVTNDTNVLIKAAAGSDRAWQLATSGNTSYSGGNVGGTTGVQFGSESGLETDLTAVPGGINELRLAFALQRYEEARARYGSRYTEYLRYLGVKSSDSRLQRPEYLGGGKQKIQISEVLATAEGEAGENVGNLAGHGIGFAKSNKFLRFFEEHGTLITMLSVAPIPIYGDSIKRDWYRTTKEDFFQKELQYIGQQEVYKGEVYGQSATPKGTFGYQDRYADYRQGFHRVSGDMKGVLDYWNWSRLFSSEPTLNSDFIKCNPSPRVFADQTEESNPVIAMVRHSIAARRLVGPGGKSFVL